jgi:hypothetical protein
MARLGAAGPRKPHVDWHIRLQSTDGPRLTPVSAAQWLIRIQGFCKVVF